MIRVMNVVPQTRLTVDEYLAWAVGRPGRYELYRGKVYAMSPENAGHAEVKYAVQAALVAGIRARRLPCHMMPDGMTVRIDQQTAFEPDALVYCRPKVAASALEIPNPVIAVEVLSPSTRRIDEGKKLSLYFRLPSVAHYLIVDIAQRAIRHHARATDDTVLTRIVREGSLTLEPPGLELAVADVFGEM